MCVAFHNTPGKQGTPMRRVAADGGRPSAHGYGGPIRHLARGAALSSLVSLAAVDVQAQSGNLGYSRAAAPPAKEDDKKKDDKDKDEFKKDEKKAKRYAFTMDGKPWKSVLTWLMDNTKKQ